MWLSYSLIVGNFMLFSFSSWSCISILLSPRSIYLFDKKQLHSICYSQMLYNIGSFNTVSGWVPWKHISRWRLRVGYLWGRVGINTSERKEEDAGQGRGRSWGVIHYQQRPQPIHEKLWNWIGPLELSWVGTRDSGLRTTPLMWLGH